MFKSAVFGIACFCVFLFVSIRAQTVENTNLSPIRIQIQSGHQKIVNANEVFEIAVRVLNISQGLIMYQVSGVQYFLFVAPLSEPDNQTNNLSKKQGGGSVRIYPPFFEPNLSVSEEMPFKPNQAQTAKFSVTFSQPGTYLVRAAMKVIVPQGRGSEVIFLSDKYPIWVK